MKESSRRILSGVIFGLTVVCGTVVLPPLFHLLALFAIAWTMHEFFEMSMGRSFPAERILAVISAGGLYVLLALLRIGAIADGRLLCLAAIPIVVAMLLPIWQKDRSALGLFPYIFAAIAYIGVPLALLPILLYHAGTKEDGLLVLVLMFTVWSGDIGAYAVGSTLGQRKGAVKIAPLLSPHKSLWGVCGSVVFACGVSLALHHPGLLNLPLLHCFAVGIIASLGGLLGDLSESMWKRHFGVKDSGKLIPGHGGLYDRLDSVILAIPLITIYLSLFGLL